MAAISAAIIKIKSPLDAFLIDFFTATKLLEDNARAAKALGTTFNVIQESFKLTTKFASELFTIETKSIDAIIKKANEAQRILNAGIQLRQQITVGSGVIAAIAAAQAAGIDTTPTEEGLSIADLAESLAAQLTVQGGNVVANLRAQISEMSREVRGVFGEDPRPLFRNFIGDIGADQLEEFLRFYNDLLQQSDNFDSALASSTTETDKLQIALVHAALAQANFNSLQEAFIELQRLRGDAVLKQKLAILETANAEKLAESGLKLRTKATTEFIKLQTQLARRGLGPGIGQQIELRAIRQRSELEINAARELFEIEAETAQKKAAADITGVFDLRVKLQELEAARSLTITQIEQNQLAETRLFLLKEQFAVQEKFLTQRDTNLQARLAGLKQVLTDFDALTSRDFVQTIFGTAGQDLVSRQADVLLEALFNPKTGLLASVGGILGSAGEATIITDAHVQGAILAAPIIRTAIVDAFATVMGLPTVGTPAGSVGKISKGRQALLAASVLGGNIFGAALGGGGKSSQTGATIGTLGGTIIGAAIGGPFAPVIGPLLGGILGGLIGGKLDVPEQQLKALQVIARNTGEQITLLENTNRLLDPTAVAFNLPSRFTLPGFAPTNFGGGGGVLVGGGSNANIRLDINVATSDSGTVGQAIAQAVADELSTQFAGGGIFAPRTGF